jgi:NitT/TauT family transport system ATP-binding protein
MPTSKLRVVPSGEASAPPRGLIEIRGLHKTYRTKDGDVPSLRPLDLDIGEGEFVAVVGPSGCGKSTLLKLMAGLIPPSGGEIRIDDTLVDQPPDNVGIVFQSPVLLAWRTVLRNIMMPVEVRRLDWPAHLARAKELIATSGLEGFENKYPYELSGGMQQRAAIARALVYDAPLLLMDEPFGALDALTREQMNLELQRIWQASGKTVVFITHSIPEAVFLADRIVVMSPRPGRVLKILDNKMARMRELDDMLSPEFGVLVREIRGLLGSHGGVSGGGRSDW